MYEMWKWSGKNYVLCNADKDEVKLWLSDTTDRVPPLIINNSHVKFERQWSVSCPQDLIHSAKDDLHV